MKRYVIMNIKKTGDINETVLPEGTTLEQAEKETAKEWDRMTRTEKPERTVHLAELECVGDEIDYDALSAKGYDWIIEFKVFE